MANIQGSSYPTVCRMETAPTTGTTITVLPPFDHVWVTTGTTTAALTIKLPPSPADGDRVRISTTSAITTLTMSPAVTGATSGLAAGVGMTCIWSAPSGVWFVE